MTENDLKELMPQLEVYHEIVKFLVEIGSHFIISYVLLSCSL